jgi:hypothetical protein
MQNDTHLKTGQEMLRREGFSRNMPIPSIDMKCIFLVITAAISLIFPQMSLIFATRKQVKILNSYTQ